MQAKLKFYNIVANVDELLNQFIINNIDRVVPLFDYNGVEYYFWDSISKIDDPLPWFVPLKNRGYFQPKKHPVEKVIDGKKYKTIDNWIVLSYLESVAKKNAIINDKTINKNIEAIINAIVDYKDPVIDSPITLWKILEILSVMPINSIKRKYLKYIFDNTSKEKWNASIVHSEIAKLLIPKIIKDKNKELLIYTLNYVLNYKQSGDKSYVKFIGTFEQYWFDEIFANNEDNFIAICGIDLLNLFLSKIKSMLRIYPGTLNYKSDLSHGGLDDYDDHLIEYVCKYIEKIDGKELVDIVSKLSESKHKVLNRLAIYAISKHYKELKDIFWEKKVNYIKIHEIGRELYDLFENNCDKFSKIQISEIIKWVENGDYDISPQYTGDKDKIYAYRKRVWLKSLLPSKNNKVIELYEKYGEKNNDEPQKPFYGIQMGPFTYGGASPVKQEVFDNIGNSNIESKIQEIINDIKKSDRPGSFSQSVVYDAFRENIAKNPAKYTNNIEPFIDSEVNIISCLLSGLYNAWAAKSDIDWAVLFEYIGKIIKQDRIYENIIDDYNNRNILYKIPDLILSGVKDDGHAFDAKYNNQAEEILLHLGTRVETSIQGDENLTSATLNSPKGQILVAMVNLSLRDARVKYGNKPEEDNSVSKWRTGIKKYFDDRLKREIDTSLEYSIIVGGYLPNLYYLDRNWVKNNVDNIYPIDKEIHWKAAIEGYLTTYNTVYKELYNLIKASKHYMAAINAEYKKKDIRKALVQHICIGYLAGWENINDDDSLIRKIVEQIKVEDYNEIINTVWRLKEHVTEEQKALLKPLWAKIIESITSNVVRSSFREPLVNITRWLEYYDAIDEATYKTLEISVNEISSGYELNELFKGLEKCVDNTPNRVGKLILLTIDNKAFPEYHEKEIISLVESLYKNGENEIADEICNRYGENQRYYLRSLYESQQRHDR